MQDLAGNEFEVGQKVLLCLPYYKELVWGTVEKIGPKMVTCSYMERDRMQQTPRRPDQVVVPMQPGYGPPAYACG